MLEQLRGRNLAHVGCTIGLVVGLIVGMVCAIVIVTLVRSNAAVNLATLTFFGLTFLLGVLGYVVGGRTSRRLWGQDTRAD
jgi:hypothetical protein